MLPGSMLILKSLHTYYGHHSHGRFCFFIEECLIESDWKYYLSWEERGLNSTTVFIIGLVIIP